MGIIKKIKVGKKSVLALELKLHKKKLIILKGKKGFVMCGYLDLAVAEKFGDCAVRITGVSTIRQALRTQVESCSSSAQRLGIYKGHPIKEVLQIIA